MPSRLKPFFFCGSQYSWVMEVFSDKSFMRWAEPSKDVISESYSIPWYCLVEKGVHLKLGKKVDHPASCHSKVQMSQYTAEEKAAQSGC